MKIAIPFLLSTLLFGCANPSQDMHIAIHQPRIETVSSSGYYPRYPQSDLELKNMAYEVYVQASGAPSRHFAERTPKTLFVQVSRRSVVKRTLQYHVTGAAINWEVTWSGPGHATLHVYDYPDHVTYYAPGADKLRREILTKRFDYDEHSDTFLEQRDQSARL